MKIFEKIVMSSTEPKFTNVLWLDTKDRTLKVFLNGAWTPTGGVGGVEEAPIDGNEYTRGNGEWIRKDRIKNVLDISSRTNLTVMSEEYPFNFEEIITEIEALLCITSEEFENLINDYYGTLVFSLDNTVYRGTIESVDCNYEQEEFELSSTTEDNEVFRIHSYPTSDRMCIEVTFSGL